MNAGSIGPLAEASLYRGQQYDGIDRLAKNAQAFALDEVARITRGDDDRNMPCARIRGDLLMNGVAAETRQGEIENNEMGVL